MKKLKEGKTKSNVKNITQDKKLASPPPRPTVNNTMDKKIENYIVKLENAVKKIPSIYYQGAMDKEWGYTTDELDVKQEKYQEMVNKLLDKPKTFDPYVDNPTTWQSDDPEKRFFKPK